MRTFVMLLLLAISVPASARDAVSPRIGSGRRLGIGAGLGSPMSLNVKYLLDQNTAFDAGVILSRYYGGVGVHGDLLFNLADLAPNAEPVDIPLYVGVGLELGTWRTGGGYYWDPWGRRVYYSRQDVNLALRVPLGLALWLHSVPLEVYTEIGPMVWMFSPVVDVFATLGVRYYL